jgi:histidinol-phosphate aminotransferase
MRVPRAIACMDKTPRSVIRDEVRLLTAYHVPDSRGLIKLDAMENPFGLPLELRSKIAELASEASLNRYPDPRAVKLKARLREVMAIPGGMELLLGNGSDELIQILALAVNRPAAVLVGVEPSFVMFRMVAAWTGIRYVAVPLTPEFGLDVQRLKAAMREHRPALTFIAYPNNPTGNLFDAEAIRALIEASPGLVVVDEAYHAFAGRSFLSELERYPNLLVMRTLSKLGLAGLRLGVLIGRPEWLSELDKLRLPYNVNVLTQYIAAYVLERSDILDAQAALIRDERARLLAGLQSLPGVRAFPSDANFILFRVTRPDAVFSGLKMRGVLIKNLNESHPSLTGCLRVTVGTAEENGRFLSTLQQCLLQAA